MKSIRAMKFFSHLQRLVLCAMISAPMCLEAHPLLVEHLRNAGFRTIEIDYHRIFQSSPRSEVELDKHYRLLYEEQLSKAKIDPDSASGAAAALEVRELLDATKKAEITGSKAAYKCIVTLGSNGILMRYSKNFHNDEKSGLVLENPNWDFLSPSALVQYDQGTETITLRTAKNPRLSLLGVLLHNFGVFGRKELAENIFSTKEFPLVADEHGGLSLKNNFLQLACEPAKNVNALAACRISIKDQVEIYSFKDYKQLDNSDTPFPTRIDYSFADSEGSRRSEIKLLSWQRDSAHHNSFPPVMLPSIGFVRVFDNRFGQGLSYNAFQKLPSDEEVVEFVNDPSKLEVYERNLLENKN